MTNFFNAFWSGPTAPEAELEPQPLRAAPPTPRPPRLVVAELATPNDDGLTDVVYMTRMVEKRMRALGLLEDERPARGKHQRVHRPANDRWQSQRRCA